MTFRTDLALELADGELDKSGIEKEENKFGDILITKIKITSDDASKRLGRKKGTYITIEMPPFTDNGGENSDAHTAVKNELSQLIPSEGIILVVGIGNTDITPDAFGPQTAERVLATRHITGELARAIGLEGLRGVAVISPGVLGKTGLESFEIIKSITDAINPSCIVCIDALASRSIHRLGKTIQICDSGIHPGSGVGNSRKELSEETLGVKIISIGVPTVVDAQTLVYDLTGIESQSINESGGMIVTPREIDLLTDRAAEFLSHAINCVLQPNINEDVLNAII